MTVDLAEFFDVDVPEGGKMKLPVVPFTISDTGRIFWNGKHMTARLYEYCDMDLPEHLHGQAEPDAVESAPVPLTEEKAEAPEDSGEAKEPEEPEASEEKLEGAHP